MRKEKLLILFLSTVVIFIVSAITGETTWAGEVSNSENGISFGKLMESLWALTGVSQLSWQQLIMICIGLLLIFLGIHKKYEPLLLIPIGVGAIMTNIPIADMMGPHVEKDFLNRLVHDVSNYMDPEQPGFLKIIYDLGISNGLFPLIIFMGVGALTDFSPLLANPKMALLGAAAQFGIFGTLLGAIGLSSFGLDFDLADCASIAIIGGADGPTSIWLSSQLSPELLGSIAVAAYSYMALVPIIQPPIMKLLTTQKERVIKMKQLKPVSKRAQIIFPLVVIGLTALLLPSAAPLIGMLMFGNLLRVCGVTDRLSDVAQNALINIVTIFLGLTVGAKMSADAFLTPETLGILLLGFIAFCIGTASGVLLAKLMRVFSKTPLNPLIGAAGVSAVPMAARVVQNVGKQYNSDNFLLMHAMGPNVAGVIGSAIAAGVLYQYVPLFQNLIG